MQKIFHSIILSALLISLGGCAGHSGTTVVTQKVNRDLEIEFSPIRFITKENGNNGSITTAEWAGTPGQSITKNSAQVQADVFQSLKANCDLDQSQLAETRIVMHKPPTFYEVWVFNDPLSGRQDKQSALSVVLKQLPNDRGVDFSVHGACHTKGSPTFYSR